MSPEEAEAFVEDWESGLYHWVPDAQVPTVQHYWTDEVVEFPLLRLAEARALVAQASKAPAPSCHIVAIQAIVGVLSNADREQRLRIQHVLALPAVQEIATRANWNHETTRRAINAALPSYARKVGRPRDEDLTPLVLMFPPA